MLLPFRMGAPSGLHEHLDKKCLSLLAIDGNELDVTTGECQRFLNLSKFRPLDVTYKMRVAFGGISPGYPCFP